MDENLTIKGARQNNLKNIDVSIPKNKLTVFTGLSGSGKSSLAFDTIFAEGQRRYVESLSSYARQFIGRADKPDVDYIEGLSPAISIDQKTTSRNPRSTVGTTTEIYDFMRLLYARIGIPHCPNCGKEIKETSIDQITDSVMAAGEGAKVRVLAPVVRGRKGEYGRQIEGYKKQGFLRFIIDGTDYSADDEIPALDKQLKHHISVVVDRLKIKEGAERRLTDSLEIALKMTGGIVVAETDGKETLYNTKYACPDCDVNIEELTPRFFSFNSPFGACPSCHGIGFRYEADVDLIVKDWNKSVNGGAINNIGWSMESKTVAQTMRALAKKYGFSLDTPMKDLPKKILDIILYGNHGEVFEVDYVTQAFSGSHKTTYEGIVNLINRRYDETDSVFMKFEYERLMRVVPCAACGGKRLRKEALAVTLGEKNIAELCDKSIKDLQIFFDDLALNDREKLISNQVMKEIKARLNFLVNVGLGYLTLSRSSATLSGGESQRIRLATQIGSGLVGVLYVLDEPSIGLHQKDNEKLIAALKRLRDLGNTLIVVEHDEDTIRSADYIVDIGPMAGVLGGEVVATGTPEDIQKSPRSITGKYLSGEMKIEIPKERRKPDGRFLEVLGASENNLHNIDVKIPVGLFTCVTGVSGSGKSSLVGGILYPELTKRLNGAKKVVNGKCKEIRGIENFDKVIDIDQSPIGRTPRSNAATYTGVFNDIRDLFAHSPDAKERGYSSGRFSFNVPGGRCENCSGDGVMRIEMNFLPDVYVPCEVCGGKRYNRETLEVRYKGKNIAEVLDMTVEEACDFFRNIPKIYNRIKTLYDVGLGYIKLGQPATELSGGEAQRVKLATELSKRGTGKTVYILDEPTTGLHSYDVDKLIKILNRLTESGNTVLVIEHNLDVIKVADYIVDLGPDGGDGGGRIVAEGSPEEVAKVPGSYTGEFLKKILS
ncbi:MAG: excinuclease ABC subunit UvrA [Clostridia bacterium]|nr:excinuclease ABC subunit UvrA [Clostridia bacterium]